MLPDTSEIIQETNRKFNEMFSDIDIPHRRCLHWAVVTCMVLREHGHRACINAGTANFRANYLPDPYPTHIGFFWQNESPEQLVAHIKSGSLPEMHCWAVIPELRMIIDPTVQFLKTIAEESGIEWAFGDPGTDEWLLSSDPDPKYYRYEANHLACVLADHLAGQILVAHLEARRVSEPHNVL
jgi:hypothetical protein